MEQQLRLASRHWLWPRYIVLCLTYSVTTLIISFTQKLGWGDASLPQQLQQTFPGAGLLWRGEGGGWRRQDHLPHQTRGEPEQSLRQNWRERWAVRQRREIRRGSQHLHLLPPTAGSPGQVSLTSVCIMLYCALCAGILSLSLEKIGRGSCRLGIGNFLATLWSH